MVSNLRKDLKKYGKHWEILGLNSTNPIRKKYEANLKKQGKTMPFFEDEAALKRHISKKSKK